MKKYIVYASKYGFTEKCVRLLQEQLPEYSLWNLQEAAPDDIKGAEALVIGGPVYAGRFPKKLSLWIQQEEDWAKDRVQGLFLTALSDRDTAEGYFQSNFPESWRAKEPARAFFGGGLDFSRLNWFESFLLKKLMKIKQDISNLDLAEIKNLSQELKSS